MSNQDIKTEPVSEPLLPCPFCGELPVQSTITALPRGFKIRCNHCWARSGDHKDAEAATNAWNIRARVPAGSGAENDEARKFDEVIAKFLHSRSGALELWLLANNIFAVDPVGVGELRRVAEAIVHYAQSRAAGSRERTEQPAAAKLPWHRDSHVVFDADGVFVASAWSQELAELIVSAVNRTGGERVAE